MLHLKCLVWCLHQVTQRYDRNLVLYSLEHKRVHPEIADSNLGDNVAYILTHLPAEDLPTVARVIQGLNDSVAEQDISEKHFSIGHYLQAQADFGPVKAGSYGIISAITPQLRGLFYLDDDGHVVETAFGPSNVGVIFGTYIV